MGDSFYSFSIRGWPVVILLNYYVDVQEFNAEMDDGVLDLHITVKGTRGTESVFDKLKQSICSKYPLDDHFIWEEYEVPRMARVWMDWMQ